MHLQLKIFINPGKHVPKMKQSQNRQVIIKQQVKDRMQNTKTRKQTHKQRLAKSGNEHTQH